MSIDWFTVIAQVLNFLILVWLMKRLLYKPVLNAIALREKGIATEIANANSKKADAEKEETEFKRKNAEFDQQRAQLLNKAGADAETERQRLLEEARKTAVASKAKREESLKTEEDNLRQTIVTRTQTEVIAIARKALTDLAGLSLEERIVDVFVRRMRELPGNEKDMFVSSFKARPDPISVCSTFALSPVQNSAVTAMVKEIFGSQAEIGFKTNSDLISGIELTSNGRKVGWSIAEYLTGFENDMGDLVKVDLKREPPGLKEASL